MRFSTRIGLFILATFLFATPTGAAFQEIRGVELGPLKVHPSLSIKEEYNNNIFLESEHEKADWITIFTQEILLELPIWDYRFQLDYQADLIKYADYGEYDTDDHRISTLLDFEFPVGLDLECAYEFISSSTPPDWEGDVRNDYYHNMASLEASYGISEIYKAQLKYKNKTKDYESMPFGPGYRMLYDPELDNYTENDYSAILFYHLSPLTSLLFEYGFANKNRTSKGLLSTDSDTHRVWVGAKWEADALVSGTIKGGYYQRAYDDPDDWSGIALLGDLTYSMTPLTTFTLALSREAKDALVTANSVYVEAWPYGSYYISTRVRLSVNHQFPHRFSASAHISYRNNDFQEEGYYEGKKRKDDCIDLGWGIDYAIQDRLGCGMSFGFRDNNSNYAYESYRESTVTAYIKMAL